MVDAVAGFAIQKLGDFLIEHVNIWTGVEEGIRWLRDELGYLQSVVIYEESRQHEESRQREELIRNWVNNVREVADESVDILDKFSQQEDAAPKQGVIHSLISYACMCKKEAKLYDIGKDIESLKKRVVDVKNRRSEYGISEMILATPNVQQKDRTIAIDNPVDVVGLEDDFKTLMAQLNSEDLSRKVIAIHGMGGLGKTSLATKLYNSSDLRSFDTRAIVCVSNEYNIKDVLKRLIKSFMGIQHEQDLSKMDERDLRLHLQKLLQDRGRYFVVIDDIWDTKGWEEIKNAFPNQKNGSRIIITTRNKKVAEMVDDKCFVHHLRFLTEEESWELFCKRAEPSQNLEKLGKEMVAKCGGLPLAIVVLSGLLSRNNKTKEYWSKVKEDIWGCLKDGDCDIKQILSLSYKYLSSQLSNCFLYLARFPEDHIIDVHVLKLLWIAEELITEDAGRVRVLMKDLAEDHLNELINRNLIQIVEVTWNGNVDKCRVHDLVRELAIDKAEEQKKLVIFDSGRQDPKPIHLLGGQRRHAIYNGVGEYLKLFERESDSLNVRSLAVKNPSGRVEVEEMKMMYTRFKKLKVLDLTSVKSNSIPKEIGELVWLKFLGLMDCRGNSVDIPASLGKLKKLQTLCGSGREQSYTIPKEIWELEELRHITCGQYDGSVNIFRHLAKLQTLEKIGYKEWVQIDTRNINNLRTLSIEERTGGGGYDHTLESVANLTSLQTFTLFSSYSVIPTIKPLCSCKLLRSVNLAGIMKDPLALNFLPDSVTSLRLRGSAFTEDPMPTLGKLTNLTTLELYNVYEGKKMVCNHNAFPSLQILRFVSMDNLEELQVEDGKLPSLISFKGEYCKRLKTIPDFQCS